MINTEISGSDKQLLNSKLKDTTNDFTMTESNLGGTHLTPFEHGGPLTIDTSHLKRDALTSVHVAAYSMGHLSNDLCAAAWFTYVPYYLQYVVGLKEVYVASASLSGQIANGITTPLVGLLSDKIKTRIGSRAPWYITGTIVVLPCFLGIFMYPNFVTNS